MEVLKSYGMGRDMARQDGARTSLAGLVAAPNDRNALLQYAQFDPQGAMGYQQDQAKAQQTRQKEVAQWVGQMAPQINTPQDWEAAVDWGVSNGYPEAEQYRGQFGNKAAIMAAGGVKPQNETQSALEREYEFVERVRPGSGKTVIDNRLDPIVNITEFDPQSNQYITRGVPRSQLTGGAAPQQQQSPPPLPQAGEVRGGYRFRGGNPADRNAWEPVGGPSQQGSGNFP